MTHDDGICRAGGWSGRTRLPHPRRDTTASLVNEWARRWTVRWSALLHPPALAARLPPEARGDAQYRTWSTPVARPGVPRSSATAWSGAGLTALHQRGAHRQLATRPNALRHAQLGARHAQVDDVVNQGMSSSTASRSNLTGWAGALQGLLRHGHSDARPPRHGLVGELRGAGIRSAAADVAQCDGARRNRRSAWRVLVRARR